MFAKGLFWVFIATVLHENPNSIRINAPKLKQISSYSFLIVEPTLINYELYRKNQYYSKTYT